MPNEQDNISAIKDFYLPNIGKLYKNKIFREELLSCNDELPRLYSDMKEKDKFEHLFCLFLEEAESTLSLLKGLEYGEPPQGKTLWHLNEIKQF